MPGNGTNLLITVRLGSFIKVDLDDRRKRVAAMRPTELPGIGDGAFQVALLISVIKGSTLFAVSTAAGPAIISEAKLQDLASTAAGRA